VLLDRNPKAAIAKIDADIMTDPNLRAEIENVDVVANSSSCGPRGRC
jgi:hypothetical protein